MTLGALVVLLLIVGVVLAMVPIDPTVRKIVLVVVVVLAILVVARMLGVF